MWGRSPSGDKVVRPRPGGSPKAKSGLGPPRLRGRGPRSRPVHPSGPRPRGESHSSYRVPVPLSPSDREAEHRTGAAEAPVDQFQVGPAVPAESV